MPTPPNTPFVLQWPGSLLPPEDVDSSDEDDILSSDSDSEADTGSEPSNDEGNWPECGSDLLSPFDGIVDTLCYKSDVTVVIHNGRWQYKILCSSRHLAEASPYFYALFEPNFEEGIRFRETGHLTLTYDDVNPAAFYTVMQAVHGRWANMPSGGIEMALLKDIAQVVDKFHLFRPVMPVVTTWVENMWPGDPEPSDAQVIDWMLYIMWVFNVRDGFKEATGTLIMQHPHMVPPPDAVLPLPIYEKINVARSNMLREMRVALRDEIQRVRGFCNLADPNGDQRTRMWRKILHLARYPLCTEMSPSKLLRLVHQGKQCVQRTYDRLHLVDKPTPRACSSYGDRLVETLEQAVADPGLTLGDTRLDSAWNHHWPWNAPAVDFDHVGWPYEIDGYDVNNWDFEDLRDMKEMGRHWVEPYTEE
ncbi:BTB/POZ domain-containing protein [Aspergillus aculeatinus CBS 121060]|uniref:Uncharacterized protein n=1 Tax=Aspergillus aculeatinus CBS 121060 TaxID=1448322 RepID=A0ACD1H7N2_9EURO|nr:hypothetical protein BO66DRAFT_97736 [Aspergillus aculeatinus CBS 121060]RAH69562.1 hypothetical protein BO66DRAFT_97736 [Aspergillus aculeatinus CBS 121060]